MVKYTNERVMKSLRKYLKNLKKRLKIDKSILFGSRARGDYFLDSDVDLIIVSPDFKDINFRERMADLLERWDEEINLEVIGYTPEEFERKKKQIGIVKTAIEEGIEI